MSERSLFAQQEANRRHARWLVIGFVAFFFWLGFGADLIRHFGAPPAERGLPLPLLGLVMCAVAGAIAAFAWWTGAERILWATGAREVTAPRTAAEQQLANVVDEMAIAAGLPRPRVWIVAEADPNAFATGRDENTAHIAVTEGLLRLCSRDELQAVVGHEMGHIRNLDVRLMTLLAAMVGAILLMRDGATRMLRASGGRGGSRRGRGDGNKLGPLALLLVAVWILSWVLAPLIGRALAFGVSRKREFLADAMSAQFTRNPLALATALEKIEAAHEPTRVIREGSAHLCIADPLGRPVNGREGRLADLLATHPPMSMRISRLRAMAYQEMKRQGTFVPVA